MTGSRGASKSGRASSDGDARGRLAEFLASGDAGAVLALFDELATQRDELTTQRDELTERLRERDDLIAQYKRLLYARSSEKLTAEELGQLVMAYGGSPDAAAAEEPQVPVPEHADVEPEEQPPAEREKKNRRKHRGRTEIPPSIKRVETIVRVPDSERGCKACGLEMTCIRHLEHSTLHYEPARLENHVELREVLVCKTPGCKCDATTAERAMPPKIKTRAGASLLALLMESKCDDALPIHRQRDQLSRLGWEIPVDTLYGWWRYCTDLLLPICDALFGYILDDPCYVGIDDTGIDVLDRHTKGGKYRGHFWCFKGSRKMVAFMFTKTWSADEIAPWIHAIPPEVFIQVDDYAGYSRKFKDPDGKEHELVPPERRLGCMMHVRRRFYEAFKLGDKRAAVPMGIFKKAYEIEAEARGMSPEDRHALRVEQSVPLLDQFDAWLDEYDSKVGKTGKLAEAIRYAKNQREFVRRCFTDGRFEIDNGAVERQIREPALGRRNFHFTGSARAARRLAGAYTLVQTCRLLGISTRDYLIDVIEKLEARGRLADAAADRVAAAPLGRCPGPVRRHLVAMVVLAELISLRRGPRARRGVACHGLTGGRVRKNSAWCVASPARDLSRLGLDDVFVEGRANPRGPPVEILHRACENLG